MRPAANASRLRTHELDCVNQTKAKSHQDSHAKTHSQRSPLSSYATLKKMLKTSSTIKSIADPQKIKRENANKKMMVLGQK